MTVFDSYARPTTIPLDLSVQEGEKKVILLATQAITPANLFMNGLFQNVLIIYDLMEVMGYSSYLLLNVKPSANETTPELQRYRNITSEEIVRHPMPIYAYIEIGMSVFPPLRTYLRSVGAKIVKLYLGNILNIDIETVQSTPGLNFPHHIVGDVDEIWTSPHYGQNRDYATVLNRVNINNSRIAPYIWEPCFITNFGKCGIQWKRPDNWKTTDIIITEPNISFQKTFLIPLLLADAFAKKCPEWIGKIQLMNTDYIKKNVHAIHSLLPSIELYKNGRVIMGDRKTIIEMVSEYPSSVFVGYQFNNDFNYMTFELLYMGFPLLHSSNAWSDFGYKWTHEKWDNAIDKLEFALKRHYTIFDTYIGHSRQLAWHHSIYNNRNQEAWSKIIC